MRLNDDDTLTLVLKCGGGSLVSESTPTEEVTVDETCIVVLLNPP
jgi:hypothetical protein